MCLCSVTLDLISSSIVLIVFVIIIISVIFIRNFILPGIRYIEISTAGHSPCKKLTEDRKERSEKLSSKRLRRAAELEARSKGNSIIKKRKLATRNCCTAHLTAGGNGAPNEC